MDRITGYLKANKAWDQTVRAHRAARPRPQLRMHAGCMTRRALLHCEQVFNEMIWYPSHGKMRNSQVSVRRAAAWRTLGSCAR
jgi:hypothetical protein